MLTLGPGVPGNVVFAMGRYCASNPSVASEYPAVSALGLEVRDTRMDVEQHLHGAVINISGVLCGCYDTVINVVVVVFAVVFST